MANDPKYVGVGLKKPEDFVKADPTKNPRYQAFQEIAAKRALEADAEAKETIQQDDLPEGFEPAPTDEDGSPKLEGGVELKGAPEISTEEEPAKEEAKVEGKEETPPKEEALSEEDEGVENIEPNAIYELTVDGKKVEVPGSKIIEAGIRTYQKEAAADVKLALATERLQTASKLLAEAEQRRGAPSQGTPTPDGANGRAVEDASAAKGSTSLELAKAIQFGTEEQAAKALEELSKTGRAVTPEQVQGFINQSIPQLVRQELSLNDARQYAATEFKDIMEKPLLRSLFDAMELQARQNGDQRPPRELYGEIGKVIREQLNLPTPLAKPAAPATREEKIAAKKLAPSMPRTAAARLEEGAGPKKPPTNSEIIAAMAARRGQGSLTLKPQ
jgi:hypothetical protein